MSEYYYDPEFWLHEIADEDDPQDESDDTDYAY